MADSYSDAVAGPERVIIRFARCCRRSDRNNVAQVSQCADDAVITQPEFSFAICTIRSVTSRLIRGRRASGEFATVRSEDPDSDRDVLDECLEAGTPKLGRGTGAPWLQWLGNAAAVHETRAGALYEPPRVMNGELPSVLTVKNVSPPDARFHGHEAFLV